MTNSSKFYAEDLGITQEQAARIAAFMGFCGDIPTIEDPKPWANYGKARVYFDVWSQNKLAPHALIEKWFYDAEANDIFAEVYTGVKKNHKLSNIVQLADVQAFKSQFSGAKTRQAVISIAEAFYGQKDAWN